MLTALRSWVTAVRRRHRERMLVDRLLRLDDHLLADMGLRRDQLQPDGIRALDAPPRARPARQRPSRRRIAVRPTLQGCG